MNGRSSNGRTKPSIPHAAAGTCGYSDASRDRSNEDGSNALLERRPGCPSERANGRPTKNRLDWQSREDRVKD